MSSISNQDIRTLLKTSKIKHWELAEALEISETTLVRKLRKELSNEEKKRIFNIIDKLIKKQ